jgi:glycosyltransferase involved in cell wall biosynthesis
VTTVLHVLEAVRGGTSRHLVDVVRHADRVDHEVIVPPVGRMAGKSGAPTDEIAVQRMSEAGAVVHRVDMRRTPWHPANGRAVAEIRRLIAHREPQLVHGHSSVGGALARASCTSPDVRRFYTPNGLASGRVPRMIERRLGRRTDQLIAVSASEARRVIELGLVPESRVTIIPNGIELCPAPVEADDLRARLGLPKGTPLVGCIARLVPQKAPEQFVRICRDVALSRPDVHFLIIGGGPLQAGVDAEVQSAGLGSRFHQLEYLAEAWAALGQMDVFVLPSAFEGGPYTPLEAMRAGVPVVLSDVVGNRDVVEDGVTGFLSPFGASEQMAAAVVRLLGDEALRASVTDAATDRLRRHFDVRVMGASLNRLYAEASTDTGSRTRRRTRRLPQPASVSSTNAPDARASQ